MQFLVTQTPNRKPSQVDLRSKSSRLKPTWANATFCPLYSKCDTVFHDIYGYFHKISIVGNKSIEVRKLRLINKFIALPPLFQKKNILVLITAIKNLMNHKVFKLYTKSLLILQKMERKFFRKILVRICKIKWFHFPLAIQCLHSPQYNQ